MRIEGGDMQPVAVVTGASSGIGAATATRLAGAGAGYHVVLTARRADRINAIADRISADGGSARACVLDVTDRAAVNSFADSLGRCDVLVNNAGGAFGAGALAESRSRQLAGHVRGQRVRHPECDQALLPLDRQRQWHIVVDQVHGGLRRL